MNFFFSIYSNCKRKRYAINQTIYIQLQHKYDYPFISIKFSILNMQQSLPIRCKLLSWSWLPSSPPQKLPNQNKPRPNNSSHASSSSNQRLFPSRTSCTSLSAAASPLSDPLLRLPAAILFTLFGSQSTKQTVSCTSRHGQQQHTTAQSPTNAPHSSILFIDGRGRSIWLIRNGSRV